MIKSMENDEAHLFFASFDGLELVRVELRWVELVARIQHGRIFRKIRLSCIVLVLFVKYYFLFSV